MPLKVVGAGFGRTGTLSMKAALEQLGFGPCYHMLEVMSRPAHVKMWHRRAFGQSINWDELFADFHSAVDWPACTYWRELAAHYSEAKVILTVRPPQSWWRSMNDTLIPVMKLPLSPKAPPDARLQREMVDKAIVGDTFDNRIGDEQHCLAVFQKHIDGVRAAIDPSRLLVFDVAESWAPLCRFLDLPEPPGPFPRLNDTAQFRQMMKHMAKAFD